MRKQLEPIKMRIKMLERSIQDKFTTMPAGAVLQPFGSSPSVTEKDFKNIELAIYQIHQEISAIKAQLNQANNS